MQSKLNNFINKIQGKNILIHGLGLNGGGVGTALFFLENNIPVTITDLKTESELQESVDKLLKYHDICKFVLGKHRDEDFANADIVVKGPGVPPTNKYIRLATDNGADIISDIEIFCNITECDIYAVTGSKGKSSTVSCIYNIFKKKTNNAFIGGNITISPLSFYRDINQDSLVILELSSWQLRDLHNKGVRIKGACITNLMRDHQNYYSNMTDYLADKLVITESQTCEDFLLLPISDKYIDADSIKSAAKKVFYDIDNTAADFYYRESIAMYKGIGGPVALFDDNIINVPGLHTRSNILIAAAFAKLIGIEDHYIIEGIRDFKGTPFRMELVATINNVKYINDTTATIPDAASAAIQSFDAPLVWIAGGNDKNLDFECIRAVSAIPKKILLLPGSGTDKLKIMLDRSDIIESSSLQELVGIAHDVAVSGDVVLFSPGCTSFGLFQNEFDRGRQFNMFVADLF